MLRVPRLDDADGAAEYLTDPDAMRFIGGETVARRDVPEVIERWLARWHADGFGHFAVERRDDGRFLGRVGVIVWDSGDWWPATLAEAGDRAELELGWAFASAHWGCGYATEAARAVRDWARRERGVERLVSLIHPDNVRSQRVARRLDAEPRETVTTREAGPAVIWLHPR